MGNPTYTVTGTVTDANTVKLDESLPLESAKVRLIIEQIAPSEPNRYSEVISEIRLQQKARKHRPPTVTEVQQYLHQERSSWD